LKTINAQDIPIGMYGTPCAVNHDLKKICKS